MYMMSPRLTLLVVGTLSCARACSAEHVRAGTGTAALLEAGTAAPRGGFLSASNTERRKELHEAISASIGAILGDRHDSATVRASLTPTWQAVNKNSHGRVDHRSFRYIVHRYLVKTHGISIVGLEPTASTNQTEDALFLKTHAPMLVKETLEGAAAEEGFSLDDVVAMIVMLKHFVKLSAEPHLEDLFQYLRVSPDDQLHEEQISQVMQSRFAEFVLTGDDWRISMLRANKTSSQHVFEDWADIVFYLNGIIRGVQYGSASVLGGDPRLRRNPFISTFTFQDALEAAAGVSLSLAQVRQFECAHIKDALARMDRTSTGRVRLADFHHARLNGEFRFSESKEYLRHFGALDETSARHGPRVIIANYVQGPSNCFAATPHFRVCCMSDCESHFGDIEAAIAAPAAVPELVLAAVAKITTFDDDATVVPRRMRRQLFDIADVHHGVVPLHGRLFAQWLHYIFPLDCPYPHKAGSMGSLSFFEFGDHSFASTYELSKHAALAKTQEVPSANASFPEEDLLAQWSHEEELVSKPFKQAAWDATPLLRAALGLVMLGAFPYLAWPLQLHAQRWSPACARPREDAHAHII